MRNEMTKMEESKIVILRRDCEALLIPSAAQIFLPKGTEVTITQSLGGTYTVNVYGNLARIDNKNADAIGKEVLDQVDDVEEDASLEDKVLVQLKKCYDPEIPVNIFDLGLVYERKITDLKEGGHQVDITMTLTAAGCGMGPVIAADVKQRVLSIPDVKEVNVEVVLDPPWNQSQMSDAAKLALGML